MDDRSDSRRFSIAAAPARVFAAIRDPERIARWWGPDGFTNEIEVFEFVPGGRWQLTMRGPDGTTYPNENRFLAIEDNRRVEIEHVVAPHFVLQIELLPDGPHTVVSWRQTFDTAAQFRPIADFIAQANQQNLQRLSAEVLGTQP